MALPRWQHHKHCLGIILIIIIILNMAKQLSKLQEELPQDATRNCPTHDKMLAISSVKLSTASTGVSLVLALHAACLLLEYINSITVFHIQLYTKHSHSVLHFYKKLNSISHITKWLQQKKHPPKRVFCCCFSLKCLFLLLIFPTAKPMVLNSRNLRTCWVPYLSTLSEWRPVKISLDAESVIITQISVKATVYTMLTAKSHI